MDDYKEYLETSGSKVPYSLYDVVAELFYPGILTGKVFDGFNHSIEVSTKDDALAGHVSLEVHEGGLMDMKICASDDILFEAHTSKNDEGVEVLSTLFYCNEREVREMLVALREYLDDYVANYVES